MVSAARTAVRVGVGALAVLVGFRLLVGWWTSVEAWTVGRLAGAVGSAHITRAGHQLLARGDAGTFVLTVTSWCSALGPVLVVAAVAVLAPGERRRRARSAAAAIALLAIGNVVRITSVVVVGADVDGARLEPFHDGPATAFTVALVLGAAAIVARASVRDAGEARALGSP